MSIALSDDHRLLATTVTDFLERHQARAANRALLEAAEEPLPAFWKELSSLGWLGLHLDEEYGGSGFGLEEVAVVVEQLGRGICPGPFVPTAVASAVVAVAGDEGLRRRLLPGLASGETVAGVGLEGDLQDAGGRLSGTAPAVLGAGVAGVLVLAVGEDVGVVEVGAPGVVVEVPANLDPSRRTGRVTLSDAPFERIVGGSRYLLDVARLLLAAEATGVARQCTEDAADYARSRTQFGRVIGTFQAVKHHCANMAVATELATAAVWDAARADGDQLSLTAANAFALAVDAAELCTNLNTQVHGGIGFTWEHDAHLYMRRAYAIAALTGSEAAAADAVSLASSGVRRDRGLDLPPEADELRPVVQEFLRRLEGLDDPATKREIVASGYAVPHWPKPWGRDAGAVEQLVIEQEFAAAGVKRPGYGITGWVILTLVQHGTEDQVARWVPPALAQELIWCQLFSEPDAGSDAAGIKTRGTRVEGGWLVQGQKVWTSGAHQARFGLATVRTNPDAPKHEGITMMVIDMHGEGVTVRPLRQATGGSDFNEVFFDGVFVPDDDVVGPVDGGWKVARATLGNESVSIGGSAGAMTVPASMLLTPYRAHPERLPGGLARIGRYGARVEAIEDLNLRSAYRAVAGVEPGPEGAVTKLVLSELGHEAAAVLAALNGPAGTYLEGEGAVGALSVLGNRALSIAGGTSEIKRNQIGERILGLPRDPLI